MDLPEEYQKLAIKLVELSNEDKVSWESGSETEFILKHNDVIVKLYPFSDPESERDYYRFSFSKVDGKIKDGFTVSNWDYGYDTLESLYNAASRNAQGIRGAIKDFLSEFE